MPADYSRIHRLLKILNLIQSESGWTAQALAQECGVAERTIFRDMKALEGAGIPYFHDSETNGYRVRRDFFMPPVQLTLEESLALVALGEHIGGREQVPLTREAAKAVAKVRGILPATVQDELEQLDDHIAIELAKSSPADGVTDVYTLVRQSLAQHRALECRYESLNRKPTESDKEPEIFRFDPYTLFFSQRAWYVVGLHHGRGETRCLKLSRFDRIQLTEKPYGIPDGFSLKDELGLAWRMIRGDERYDVELEFDEEFAETIADTHWHATQTIEWVDDRIVFRCTVDGLDEIVWWVLSMGPHCVVRSPDALADRVHRLAVAVVDHYAAD